MPALGTGVGRHMNRFHEEHCMRQQSVESTFPFPFPKLSFMQHSPFRALTKFEMIESSAMTVVSVGGVDKCHARVSCSLAFLLVSLSIFCLVVKEEEE